MTTPPRPPEPAGPDPLTDPSVGDSSERGWNPSLVTVVWGLFLLLVAALGAGYGLLGLRIDPVLAAAVVVAGCGLLLVLVAAYGAHRRARG